MSTTIIHQKPSNLLLIPVGTGMMQYEILPGATMAQKSILAALNAPKIKDLTDRELDTLLFAFVNKALILLGHSRQLNGDDDQHVLISELALMLREKWHFYTAKELQLVLQMGVRGDLKNKPEDVVFLNIEQVNSWLKKYKEVNRPEAMKHLKPYEAPKQQPKYCDMEALLQSFIDLLQAGHPATELAWICQTATHYQWMDTAGIFGLSLEDKKRIYAEEKALVERNAKYKLEHVNAVTKGAFAVFMSNSNAANPYEKEVLTNCRIRVFRQYVERQLNSNNHD